ncbi:MAG TPA: FG-GAP and VCBS repeat-containing protein, partial [Kineosporiaceae bacterium]|nr:FG-GAP and VCBS repeat-containing protein [Kineosporiaceae bacterium]
MNCVRVFAGALAVAAVSATLGLTTPADARTTKDAVTTAAGAPSTVKIVRDGITLVHQRTPVGGHTLTGQGPTRSDFDGDGRDDLAVTNGQGVVVAYSSAPIRDYLTTELPAAVPMGCTCLGRDIVTGNFNGDKYDDLVVANFDEADLKVKATFAGAVWIILGGPGGLRVDQVTHVNQSTSGVSGTSAASDAFGSTLAAGDVTGDGMDELLIGIPNKKVGGKKEAGAVVVLKGSSTGTVTSGAQWLDQSTPGVPGAPEYRDHFGQSIAVGKLNKNKYRDVVIGAPWEDDGKQFWGGSGVVTQFWGSSAGVSLKKITTVSGHATAPIAKPQEIVLWYFGTSLVIADTTG